MELAGISPFQVGFTILSAVLFAWITRKVVLWIIYRKRLSTIPSPVPGHWLLGHMAVLADRIGIREKRWHWQSVCPRIQLICLTQFMPMVNIIHGDPISTILRSSAPKHDYIYGFLRPWLGDGLLLSNGRKWARDRRLLTHCFHFDILRSYTDVYNNAVGIMIQKWEESCAAGEKVDISEACTLLTLDIILRCAMGFESNCQASSDDGTSDAATYAHSVQQISRLFDKRLRNIPHHSDFVYSLSSDGRKFRKHLQVVHALSRHLIAERRAALREEAVDSNMETSSTHSSKDFLDVLLTVRDEENVGLSDDEIREQVDTFLFRGHDTTSSALQCILYYLSQHEEMQEKCRCEVLDVLDKSGDISGQIEHDHLHQLTYLTQFIKESLRLGSPVPFIIRGLAEDTGLDKYSVPAGAHINVSILDCHRNRDHWENALEFDPDRFSAENSEGRHPFAFVPFSAGPRNCIGQKLAMDEMQTVIASILRRFRVVWDPEEAKPQWRTLLVSRTEHNMKVRLVDLSVKE